MRSDPTPPPTTAALQSALSASGFVGTWETDLTTKTVHLFGPFAQQLGLEAAEAANGVPLARFLDGLHPDDRDRVEELVNTAHRTAGRFECEFRTIGLDDGTYWISARGQVETDPQGRGLRCLGVALDVSDTRRAESVSDDDVVHTIGQIVDSLTALRLQVTILNIPTLNTLIDVLLFECGRQLAKRMPEHEVGILH